MTPQQIQNFLDQHCHEMEWPQVWYGDEPNTYHKAWNYYDKLRVLWMAPWDYGQFTGNQTIPLLYTITNQINDGRYISERSHFPGKGRDVKLFERFGIPPFGLESRHVAGDFHVIGTSLGYPPFFFNIVKQLKWAGIPVRWRERQDLGEPYPLLIAGGSIIGSPLPWAPIMDLVWMGEAEDEPGHPGLSEVFGYIEKAVADGSFYDVQGREDMLHAIARDFDFIWVPKFVYPRYDDDSTQVYHIVGFDKKYDDLPTVRRRFVRDMDRATALERPVVPYRDPSMGPGEVEVARGCTSHCVFCAVTFRYSPYRERSPARMVELLRESVKWSGSDVAFPTAYEYGTYSQKKRLVKLLLEEVSDYVDTQSIRVDSFAEDPAFGKIAVFGGMKQLSIGVEGNSQRMRDFVSKGCYTEQILVACNNAFRAGYDKVKLYMIADLPFETQDDTDEIIDLCKKILDLRNQYGLKATVRCSWTPLLIEGFTPIQWFAPTLEEKRLEGIYTGLKEIGVGYNLGKKTERNYSYWTQVFHLADWRAAEALVDTAIDTQGHYIGSVPRNTKDVLARNLIKHGHPGYDVIMGPKPLDTIFPWDFFDMRVSKKWMLRLYMDMLRFAYQRRPQRPYTDSEETIFTSTLAQVAAAKQEGRSICGVRPESPYLALSRPVVFTDDRVFPSAANCFDSCVACGACDKEMLQVMREWGQAQRIELAGESPLRDIHVIDQRSVMQKLRFRVNIAPYRRFLENDVWKQILRRACYLSDVPITKKSIRLLSDRVLWRNWVAGLDYGEFGLIHVFTRREFDEQSFIAAINEHTKPFGMTILDVQLVPPSFDSLRREPAFSLCAIPVAQDAQGLDLKIAAFKKANYIELVLKEVAYRAGLQRTKVNLKDYVDKLWWCRDGATPVLKMYVHGEASPYDVMTPILGFRGSKVYQFPAIRIDSFLATDEESYDFFRPVCVSCERMIPVNLFDQPFDSDYCPPCKDELSK